MRKSAGIFCFTLMAALITAAPSSADYRVAQEARSTITVLVDLSETWLNPRSDAENRRLLNVISDLIVALAVKVKKPVAIRFLAIGDKSLGRLPLCQATFLPNILAVKGGHDELVSIDALEDFAAKDCVRAIMMHKPETYTDISGALDSVSRISELDQPGLHALVVLSDFQEDRRKNQIGEFGRLDHVHALLLYRVLDEDRINSRPLDARIHKWEEALRHSGAVVSSIDDVSVDAGALKRVLLQ